MGFLIITVLMVFLIITFLMVFLIMTVLMVFLIISGLMGFLIITYVHTIRNWSPAEGRGTFVFFFFFNGFGNSGFWACIYA